MYLVGKQTNVVHPKGKNQKAPNMGKQPLSAIIAGE